MACACAYAVVDKPASMVLDSRTTLNNRYSIESLVTVQNVCFVLILVLLEFPVNGTH